MKIVTSAATLFLLVGLSLMTAAGLPGPKAWAAETDQAQAAQAVPPLTAYLFRACFVGTVEELAAVVAAGADVNATDERFGETPLMLVAFGGADNGAAKAEILLKAGADVNAKDPLGTTALHKAAKNGNLELAKTLLAAGADINAFDNDGDTPLSQATQVVLALPVAKQVALLKFLIDSGADIRPRQPVRPGQVRPTPPLLRAAYTADPEIIQLLLAAGCPVDEGTEAGYTPLMAAANRNSNPETVRLLLQAGADVTRRDDKGQTALDKVRHNQTPAAAQISSLLEAALKKSPPLPVAVVKPVPPSASDFAEICLVGTVEEVAETVAAGADVNAADKRFGSTALMNLAWNKSKIGAAKAEILLKAGADVNAKNFLRSTALHEAAHFGSLDLAKTLVAAGADINAVDNLGATPLVKACGITPAPPVDRHVALLKLLLDAGADIQPRQPVIPGHTRTTPLLSAADSAAPEVIKLLLAIGCPVDEGTETGHTPLMSSVRNPNPETVRVLLEAGADATRRDDRGLTALDKAQHNAKYFSTPAAAEIIRMLEAAMKKTE